MGQIILRTPLKRFQGLSSTGKSYIFLTSNYDGDYYSIPKWSVTYKREYDKTFPSGVHMRYIEVRFDSKAIEGAYAGAVSLKNTLNLLEDLYKNETKIIR